MIVTDTPRELEISENLTPNNFRIKASKKAFEILSSGLYSDKIKAIIRELSTNAADSHVAAGKATVPFTVHLPNTLEPHFSIHDDGVGLSDEQINGIYTTYFDSNKTNSNDLTGCLGLGSKSPFSYTEQFTVESRWNGRKITYNCFINEEGVPSLVKLCDAETTECNGVEVKLPVKSQDFYEFCQKAEEVLCWFDVPPIVTGNTSFSLKTPDYMRRTDKYGLRKERTGCSYVVMGNVAYRCHGSDLRSANVQLTDLERKVMEWGCDLFVPIGSIEITANREEVSYDPRTVTIIRDHLTIAVEDIKKEVENMVAGAQSLWAARRMLHDARHSILGQIRSINGLCWNGKEIVDFVDVMAYNRKLLANASAADLSKLPPAPPLLPPGVDPKVIPQVKCDQLHRRKEKYRRNVCDTIHADGKPIILDDLPKGGYVRMITYLNEHDIREAYYLPTIADGFLDETGIGEVVIRTSSLPKPTYKSVTRMPRRKGSTAKLNVFDSGCRSNNCAEYWQPAEVDLSAGGIYVEISYYRFKKTSEANPEHPTDLRYVVETLKLLGYNEKVYGIRPTDVKMLQKHEGWVSLEAFVEAVLDEHKDLEENIKKSRLWFGLTNKDRYTIFKGQQFAPTSLFGRVVAEALVWQGASLDTKTQAYCGLANKFGMVLPDNDLGTTLYDLANQIDGKYPLLNHLSWYDKSNRGFIERVTKYINMVDAQ